MEQPGDLIAPEQGSTESEAPVASSAGPRPGSAEVARIDRAIDALPPDQRQVLALRYRAHRSFDEIARETGRTVAQARELWSRAVETLAEGRP